MASAWGTSWGGAWGVSWGTTAATPVEPTPSRGGGGGGGGGFWLSHKKRWKYLVDNWVDETLREKYEALLEVPEAKAQAAKVVKPFAETRAKTPQPATIDWAAVEASAQATARLIELYNKYLADQIRDQMIEAEDEHILFGLKR